MCGPPSFSFVYYRKLESTRLAALQYFRPRCQRGMSTGRAVSSLIIGGQCLRAGDPRRPLKVTEANRCVFCLERGRRTAETLYHVVFECPTYDDLRHTLEPTEALAQRDPRVLCIHRDVWKRKQLRGLISYYMAIISRRRALAGGKEYKVWKFMEATAREFW